MKMPSELPTDIVVLHKLVLEQDETIRSLREQLLLALRRQFGPRSEQVSVDQLPLFESDAAEVDLPVPEVDEDHKTTERPTGARRGLCSQGLPREIREIDIPECAKICPCCAGRLHAFGFDASEQVHYVPAILKVIETRRLKYSCRRCHEGVLRAPADRSSPIPKSMASASLIAYLAVCKFADHQPAFRVAAQFRRMGVELSDALMSEWLIQSAELLEGLHQEIMATVLASGHIFTDDTILPMQATDPERGATLKSRIWCYATHHRRGSPLVAYEFSLTRSQQVPLNRLIDYAGYVQADAFPGYDRLFENPPTGRKAIEVACWAHARRKFIEVAALTGKGRAHDALRYINRLFRIERDIRHINDADRRTERMSRALPVLKALKAWLDREVNSVLPRSALGTAVIYSLSLCSHQDWLASLTSLIPMLRCCRDVRRYVTATPTAPSAN